MSEIINVAEDAAQGMGSGLPADNGKVNIKVIGIGGGGNNTIQYMIEEKVKNVEFIAVNTDLQALNQNLSEKRIQIGVNTTRGLGSGSKPEVGKAAAEESREDLKQQIGPVDIAFITAGMGGGTGTGASPVVAQIVKKELGALTVAIVTKPYSFEGPKQMQKAIEGIKKLKEEVDALIVIPNDKLLKYLPKDITLIGAFAECNKVLKQAVTGISDLIERAGYINLDFNDIRTVLTMSGTAVIGMGSGSGKTAVEDAIQDAIKNPLLEDVSNCSVKGVLVNITVSKEFPLSMYGELGDKVERFARNEDANTKYGVVIDENKKKDEVGVTVVLTGITGEPGAKSVQRDPEPMKEPESMFDTDDSGDGGFFSIKPSEEKNSEPESAPSVKQSQFEDDFALPEFLRKRAKND